jgi:hypothetical protein
MGWHAAHVLVAVHVSLPGHVPQFKVPPHPFGMLPHTAPCAAQVVGVQHVLFVHTWPPAHPPQFSVPPQPSAWLPHRPEHDAGEQHRLAVEQTCPAPQLAQKTGLPHPSDWVEHDGAPAQGFGFGAQQTPFDVTMSPGGQQWLCVQTVPAFVHEPQAI